MGIGRRTSRIATLAAVLALPACYTYVPVERPRAGTEVRVKVPVRSSVGTSTREPEMVAFEGTLVSLGDTLLLQTRTHQVMSAHREVFFMDTVRVLATDFRDLEERVLSKPRTAAFTAAVIGGGALLVLAIEGLAGSDGGDKPGDGGQTQGSRVTTRPSPAWRLFGVRIPLPWPSG